MFFVHTKYLYREDTPTNCFAVCCNLSKNSVDIFSRSIFFAIWSETESGLWHISGCRRVTLQWSMTTAKMWLLWKLLLPITPAISWLSGSLLVYVTRSFSLSFHDLLLSCGFVIYSSKLELCLKLFKCVCCMGNIGLQKVFFLRKRPPSWLKR